MNLLKKNYFNYTRKELYNIVLDKFKVELNYNTFSNWVSKCCSGSKHRHINRELKEKIIEYMKLQHRHDYIWLHNHIKKKFKVNIPKTTVRTWKKEYNILTNVKQINREQLKYIRLHWRKQSDEELARSLIDKFQRTISVHRTMSIRHKYHWYRPQKVGLKVKRIEYCKYCGKEIKITCQNPTQQFCNRECFAKYRSSNSMKKYKATLTPDSINKFLKSWTNYAKKVIYENRYTLDTLDRDEVFTSFIGQIPSLIYHLERLKIKSDKVAKPYIAKAIKNLIYKKLRKKIEWEKNTCPIERKLEMNKV